MQLVFGTSSHDPTEISMWKSSGKTLRRVSISVALSSNRVTIGREYLGVAETLVGSLLCSKVLPCVIC